MIQENPTSIAGEIEQTVAAIFEAMMGIGVQPISAVCLPRQREMATIHFSGSWKGVLTLELGESEACRFAARFLSTEVAEAVDNDVRDVLGELANMIGGNLKCILAPGAVLSIPEVICGSDFSVRICGRTVAERQAFRCEDGTFWISLFETPQNES